MRIVQLANFYSPTSGGLRTTLHRLAEEYERAGHEVVRIVPGQRLQHGRHGATRHIEVRGHRLGRTGYRVVLDRAIVESLIAQINPDVIELSDKTTLVGTAQAARERGVPVVMLSHERLDTILGARVPGYAPLAAATTTTTRAWNRRLARQCDAIVCASHYAASEWAGVADAILHHIPLGVDLNRFTTDLTIDQAATSATEPRTADPSPRGRPLELVCVGRLSVEKNPALALATVRELVARGVNCRLSMVGDGALSEQLRCDAADLPVRFLGHLSGHDVAQVLQRADAALAPCRVETFGLAALEALACGTPVVVAAQGALPELVPPGAGAAARPHAAAFADAVMAVCAADRSVSALFARAHAEQFPWSATAAAMLQVMRDCIDGRQTLPPVPAHGAMA